MKPVIRVVKRGEREAANSSHTADSTRVAQQSRPEMIIKSWITASRERRRAEAADHLRDFKQWKENLCPLGAQ